MSEFDLDEILAELDEKRKNKPAKKSNSPSQVISVEDILRESGEEEIFMPKREQRSAAEVREKLERDRAAKEAKAKAELAEQKWQERLAEQKRLAEERERAAEEKRRKLEEERRKKAEEDARAREERRKKLEEEEKRKRELAADRTRRAETKRLKAEEEEAERKRLEQEADRRKEREAAMLAELDEETRRKAEKEAAKKRREEEESERQFATKNIVFEEAPIELPKIEEPKTDKPAPPTTQELELERTLREQKIQSNAQKLLERESSLEDPDDFLAAINPYDDAKSGGMSITQMIETIPAQQLSGDTVGVAGNDLKKLSRNSSAANERSVEEIIGGDTVIVPGTAFREVSPVDLEKTFVLKDVGNLPKNTEIREKSTVEIDKPSKIDPMLVNINKTIERKRLEDIQAESPYSVTAQLELAKPLGAGFDISNALMPQTGEVPVINPAVSEKKMKYISSRRKRIISDFVLEDITDGEEDDFGYDDELEADDEDDEQIWSDLTETHKSLRTRFILLLIISVIVCGATILQELGVKLAFSLFGAEINFLDKRYDTDGFIFFNLGAGVIGAGLCAAAISTGIIKLFKRRPDCDSLCAVTTAVSLITGVLMLINTDYLQRSRAFLYIPAALLGLLFNTLGKLSMISRAKKNFRFISSGGSKYYADICDDENAAGAFTKGVVSELPVLAAMRKTEYLTDFLRESYCEDKADRLSRVLTFLSLAAGAVMGLLIYLVPNSEEGMQNNVYWAISVFNAFLCIFSPLSIMFMVNNPLRRATKAMLKSGSTILGCAAAEEFSQVNAVMTEASSIFPPSCVECTNLKPCRLQNSINNISLDQAIILAASLSIKTGSILSRLFFEMIGGKEELLEEIEGCVCEDNMGVLGWYGNKRLIMGNREHMKHHSIKVPELSAIAKYCRNGSDAVYLAVGGELSIIFFIRLTANESVRDGLHRLAERDVSVIVKSTDSIITVGKIADLFDIDPENIRIIPSNLHEQFTECTKYTSSGSGAFSGNGSFSGFARGICTAKKLMRDISLSQTVMLAGVFLAAVLGIFLAFSTKTLAFSPTVIMLYQLFWILPVLVVQLFRRY